MAHILIIDDEISLRTVMTCTLSAAGHNVSQAGNGREGLAALGRAPTDLVITDLVMPEQDGVEMIMALRLRFPTLPVIAMSGDLRHSALYLEIATRLGVRRTLAKPFTGEALLSAVDETLERIYAA